MFFPIVLFGKSKLYMIPVYKISKSNIKQHLKKEIRKAYEYYNNEKNGIYYGILTTDLINAEEKSEVYYLQIWHKKYYALFPTLGVAYVSGMPIFLIGEENLRFLKPINKKKSYNMIDSASYGMSTPYMSFFRVVAPKSKEVKKSDKQKNK